MINNNKNLFTDSNYKPLVTFMSVPGTQKDLQRVYETPSKKLTAGTSPLPSVNVIHAHETFETPFKALSAVTTPLPSINFIHVSRTHKDILRRAYGLPLNFSDYCTMKMQSEKFMSVPGTQRDILRAYGISFKSSTNETNLSQLVNVMPVAETQQHIDIFHAYGIPYIVKKNN